MPCDDTSCYELSLLGLTRVLRPSHSPSVQLLPTDILAVKILKCSSLDCDYNYDYDNAFKLHFTDDL